MPLRHSNDEKDRIRVIDIIVDLLEKHPQQPEYMRFYQAALERVSNPTIITKDVKFPIELLCPTSTFNIITSYDKLIPIEIVDSYNKLLKKDTIYTITISCGSDSMLCCYIAVKLGYKVVAMMIDYGNREEHLKEIDFVSWFCKQLNVPFYVRYINIQRTKDDMREFYEKVTKNIRFNSYKYLMNPVILGHNKDDCFENIITNILSLKSQDNLFGMKSISEIMGVTIIRPVLDIPKKQIVELCNMYNIPFLLDSTPKWSRRGMIRDNIVPSLNGFDINLIPRMMEFCKRSSDSQVEYDILLDSIPINKIDNTYIIEIVKWTSLYLSIKLLLN
jgi:tRNA(Ile)-lysidine synthetase-like protein